MQTLDRDELTGHVQAPPDVICRLVTGVTRIPESSPETRRSDLHRGVQETPRKITAVAGQEVAPR
jgi:hypothetical protein